jgi:PKHD-type hydroxylase
MPSVAIMPNVFSADECQKIIQLGKGLVEQKANIESTGTEYLDDNYRNGKFAVFSPDDDQYAWIFDKSRQVLSLVNGEYWKFDLDGEPDYMQFTIYEEGDFYDWHLDIGEADSETGKRKISSSVQLSDPVSYENGDLELFVGQEERAAPKDLGSMIIFPSYSLHRVKPVTKGIRYSLVHWMSGNKSYK